VEIKHSVCEETGFRSVEIIDLEFIPWTEPRREVPIVYTCDAVITENANSWDDAGRDGVDLDVTIINFRRSDDREPTDFNNKYTAPSLKNKAHWMGVYLIRGIKLYNEFEHDLHTITVHLCNTYNALSDDEPIETEMTREDFAAAIERIAPAFRDHPACRDDPSYEFLKGYLFDTDSERDDAFYHCAAHNIAILINDECERYAGEMHCRLRGYSAWGLRTGGWSYSLLKNVLLDARAMNRIVDLRPSVQ